MYELTVGHDGIERQHVVHGEPILQAMRATRVLRYVAADRAHLLARGVWCVVIAVRRHLPRDLEIRHTGFNRDAAIRNIDLEHTIESRERDDDAARDWHRTA